VLTDLDAADRGLLDRVQAGVPLVPRPFAALGALLGVAEADVLARLRRLAAAHVLRQIGAIFDTRTCGFASALVAARVGPGRLETAAALIGAHPGVSHCYERDHAWNLWFTLAVAPTSGLGLDASAARLGALAGAESVRVLPALRTFKIAARFDLEAEPAPSLASGDGLAALAAHRRPPAPLSQTDIAVVRALQRPLALVPEPFAEPAREAGLAVDELLVAAAGLRERGVMRRFAGLLNHRRAGFGSNVMGVWAVPQDRREAAGRSIAQIAAVTHCYERPTFPDWPYSLFSMVHGRSREACDAVLGAIAEAVRPDAAATLWTVREFKKTRLQLFTPEYEAWETTAEEVTR